MSSASSNFMNTSGRTPASRRRPISMYGSDMSSGNVLTNSAYDSLDDWGGTSVTSSTPPSHLQRGLSSQNLEIIRLNSEVALLKEQLAGRPSQADMDELRDEWQTSEELFAESQKDNESKHTTIELQRQYIKALEGKLEEVLGPSWKECCVLPPLHPNPQPFPGASINTPLPGMRNSTATKRVRHGHGHARHASLDRGLTPPGARASASGQSTPLSRSHGGRSLSMRDSARDSTHSTREFDTSASSAGDRLDVDAMLGAALPRARQGPHSPTPTPGPGPGPVTRDRVLEQVEALGGLVKGMPRQLVETVLEQLELNEAMRKQADGRRDALGRKEREEEARAADARLETRNRRLLEMLDAAERRAEARELRLQAMLAEAKTASGQMDW